VFNGFSIGALWAPSSASPPDAAGVQEPHNATDKSNYYDAAIRWTPGPFGAAAAFGKNKIETGAGVASESKISSLSANWDNKAFGIYGNYTTQKNDALGTEIANWKGYSLSGVARFAGRHELYLMGSKLKNDKITNMEATTYGITYENVMSKRTRLYVGYGATKNKDAAAFAPTAYAFATAGTEVTPGGATANNTALAPGKDPKAFQVGISHSF
jgi:predicted porin